MGKFKLKCRKIIMVINISILSFCNITSSYATGIEILGGIAIGQFVSWLCTAALGAGALYVGYECVKDDIKRLDVIIDSVPYMLNMKGLKSIQSEKDINRIKSATGMSAAEANAINNLYNKVVSDSNYVVSESDYDTVSPAIEKVARKYVFANGIEYKENNTSFGSDLVFNGKVVDKDYFSEELWKYAWDKSIGFIGGYYSKYQDGNAQPVSGLNMESVMAAFVKGAINENSMIHSINIKPSRALYIKDNFNSVDSFTSLEAYPFNKTDICVLPFIDHSFTTKVDGSVRFENYSTIWCEILYYTSDNSVVNFTYEKYYDLDKRVGYALVGTTVSNADIYVYNPLFSGSRTMIDFRKELNTRNFSYMANKYRNKDEVILKGNKIVMNVLTNSKGEMVCPGADAVAFDQTIINTHHEPKVVDKPYIGWGTSGVSVKTGTNDRTFEDLLNCDNLGDASRTLAENRGLVNEKERKVVAVPVSKGAIDDAIPGEGEGEGEAEADKDKPITLPSVFDTNITSIAGEKIDTADGFDFEPLNAIGDAITNKFPFSLPWDLMDLIRVFLAPPKAPHFVYTVDFSTKYLKVPPTKFELDMAEYEQLAKIIRFFLMVGFIGGLIKLTGNLTKH